MREGSNALLFFFAYESVKVSVSTNKNRRRRKGYEFDIQMDRKVTCHHIVM
jgi:hypothetical protein